MVVVSAQVESELVDLERDDKREFLESLGALWMFEVVWGRGGEPTKKGASS